MGSNVTEIAQMPLSGTESGKITVDILEAPYGEGSESVVSIGVALQSEAKEPDWKVHIPKANIDALIEALKRAKDAI